MTPPEAPVIINQTGSSSAETVTTPEAPVPAWSMRLPTSLLPAHYSVELEPRMYEGHVDNFTFRGSVDILMKCVEATNNITVHMKGLSLVNSSIALSAADGAAVPAVVDYEVDRMYDFLVLNLAGQLEAGRQYHIYIDFSAPLLHYSQTGFYLAQYVGNGTIEYLALTQFEMTHARQAFPCFDEPALKATYDVTLVRRNDHSALSNMPNARSEARGTYMTADIFNTTVKMSTYTVAFVVSKFSGLAALTASGVQVGVWSRPEVISTAHYALDFVTDVLEYFESFYNISYPPPKLDLFASPFAGQGVSQSWGLAIYRESSMLIDPADGSAVDHQRVAYSISQESSQLWFGNLVTCSWWDDLWLNEGFGTLEGSRGVGFIYPEWRMWEMFITDLVHEGFKLDEAKSSNPLHFPVEQPEDIKAVTTDNPLAYYKGASVIRMLQHFLGEDVFWTGVKTYLKTHAYGSVTYHDLAEALDSARGAGAGGISIKEMLETWILQMNYPVVTITRSADHAFTVSQARFVLNHDEEESEKFSSPYGYRWDIPFTFTTNLEKDFNTTRTYVMRRDAGLEEIFNNSIIPDWNNTNWVIGNVREMGFYRVNYDRANWMALIRQLNDDYTIISPENRAQLINDAWNLVKAGLTDASIALGVSRFLENDESYISWKAAEKELDYVDQMLARTDVYGILRKFMRVLATKQYLRLGFNEQDAHLDKLLQPVVVKYACRYDVTECVAEARRLFAEWMTNETRNPIPQELKDTVYCTAIAHGDESEWDFAFRIYQSYSKTDFAALHEALGCSRQRWILLRFLDIGRNVPTFGAVTPIHSMAHTSLGSDLVWDFIQRYWDELPEAAIWQGLSKVMVSTFHTKYDRTKFQRLVSEHNLNEESFSAELETVDANTIWMDRNKAWVRRFLDEQTLN